MIWVPRSRFHSNVLAMYARTCSHFRLAGGRHLESMPTFSRFGLARVNYMIMSSQKRTHGSVSASSRYVFPLTDTFSRWVYALWTDLGGLGPIQSASCTTLLGLLPRPSTILSIVVRLHSPQVVACPLRASCLLCSTWPSALQSVRPLHVLNFLDSNFWRSRPSLSELFCLARLLALLSVFVTFKR